MSSILTQDTLKGDSSKTTTDVKMCRICLTTKGKLTSLKVNKNLNRAYETLTLVKSHVMLPKYLCSECSYRLLRAYTFKLKCMEAQLVLLRKLKTHKCDTLKGDSSDTKIIDVEMCRICLTTEGKLTSLKVNKNLNRAYETLTGVKSHVMLPNYLCSECSYRLLRAYAFKLKCMEAKLVLLKKLKTHKCITVETIKSVVKKTHPNKIKPSLGITQTIPNHNDLERVEVQSDLNAETDIFKENTDPLHEDEIEYDNAVPMNEMILYEIETPDSIETEKIDMTLYEDEYVEVLVPLSDEEVSDGDGKEIVGEGLETMEEKDNAVPMKEMILYENETSDSSETENRDMTLYEDDNVEVAVPLSEEEISDDDDVEIAEKDLETTEENDNGISEEDSSNYGFGDEFLAKEHLPDNSLQSKQILQNIEKDVDKPKKLENPVKTKRQILENIGKEIDGPKKIKKASPKEKDVDKPKKLENPVKTKRQILENIGKEIDGPKKIKKVSPRRVKTTSRNVDSVKRNPTIFNITVKTVEEQRAEFERRKQSSKYIEAKLACTICYLVFAQRETFDRHMLRHTEKFGDHKCDICQTYYPNRNALRKHVYAHHSRTFSCTLCPYVTTNNNRVKPHELWHRGTKFKCPHCEKEFTVLSSYKNHVRSRHRSNAVCALCGHSLTSAAGLRLHMRMRHALSRTESPQIPADGPVCSGCNVQFASQDALNTHLEKSATYKPNVESSEEGKEKSNQCQMLYMENPHKRVIYCEQCGEKQENATVYYHHFKKEHPDKQRTDLTIKSTFMCEECGKVFRTKYYLQQHRYTHAGLKPLVCSTCGKRFSKSASLFIHKRLHREDKTPYPCEVCGKKFTTTYNRGRHMLVHTVERPFKCNVCGKSYKSKKDMQTHVDHVHLKKTPWPKRIRRRVKPKVLAKEKEELVEQVKSDEGLELLEEEE